MQIINAGRCGFIGKVAEECIRERVSWIGAHEEDAFVAMPSEECGDGGGAGGLAYTALYWEYRSVTQYTLCCKWEPIAQKQMPYS